MTDDLVKRARKAVDGVTPGPWAMTTACNTWGWLEVKGPSFKIGAPTHATDLNQQDEIQRKTDARFIAAARDLVPAMADRIEAAEAELTAANQRAAASLEAVARANAERDALVAAAYEALCETCNAFQDECYTGTPKGVTCEVVGFFRPYYDRKMACLKWRMESLTPPHATAALDRIKADARADGYADGVRKAADRADTWTGDWDGGQLCDAILALIPTSPPAEAQADFPEVSLEAVVKAQAEINERYPAIGSGRLVEVEEPAQVTVQEAAKVLLDWAEHNTFGDGGDFADAIGAAGITTLRAIAGE